MPCTIDKITRRRELINMIIYFKNSNFFFIKKVILVDGETDNSFIIEIGTLDHNTHVF
jgi:predicted ATP-dependent endonuclease of OLD family